MMLEFARRPFCPMVDDTLCTPTSSQAGRGFSMHRRERRHWERSRQMMPLERTGAFTLASVAVLLVVVLAIAFSS
jgi:hypothetical protein